MGLSSVAAASKVSTAVSAPPHIFSWATRSSVESAAQPPMGPPPKWLAPMVMPPPPAHEMHGVSSVVGNFTILLRCLHVVATPLVFALKAIAAAQPPMGPPPKFPLPPPMHTVSIEVAAQPPIPGPSKVSACPAHWMHGVISVVGSALSLSSVVAAPCLPMLEKILPRILTSGECGSGLSV